MKKQTKKAQATASFSSEQIAKIEQTFLETLGEEASADLIKDFHTRFDDVISELNQPKEEEKQEREGKQSKQRDLVALFAQEKIQAIVAEKQVEHALEIIRIVKSDEDAAAVFSDSDFEKMVKVICSHGRSYELIQTLKLLKEDEAFVPGLVRALIKKQAVFQMAEALRIVPNGSDLERLLALSIAKTGSVDQLTRSIGISGCSPEIQGIWAMEIIGKGSTSQMLEALKLIDKRSSGAMVLATGIISRKETTPKLLLSAIEAAGDNKPAVQALTREVVLRGNVYQHVGMLEDGIHRKDPAMGELVASRIAERDRMQYVIEGIKLIGEDSVAEHILTVQVTKTGTIKEVQKAYKYASAIAKGILIKKVMDDEGAGAAKKIFGSEMTKIMANDSAILKARKTAIERHQKMLNTIQDGREKAKKENPSINGV